MAEQGQKRKLSDLDQKLVKGLLNKFSYDCKRPGEAGEEARSAKAVWASLTDELKASFVTNWQAESKAASSTKGGWKWVTTWAKTYSSQVEVATGNTAKYEFPGAILKSAGMSFSDFREGEWRPVVEQMVKDNAAAHNHSGECIEHPRDARLSRWFWVQDLGTQTKSSTLTKEELSRSCGLSEGGWKDALGGGGAPELSVKLENPTFVDLQTKLGNLGSLVGQLQRQVATTDGLAARPPPLVRGWGRVIERE